jgi:hypothetical protein
LKLEGLEGEGLEREIFEWEGLTEFVILNLRNKRLDFTVTVQLQSRIFPQKMKIFTDFLINLAGKHPTLGRDVASEHKVKNLKTWVFGQALKISASYFELCTNKRIRSALSMKKHAQKEDIPMSYMGYTV